MPSFGRALPSASEALPSASEEENDDSSSFNEENFTPCADLAESQALQPAAPARQIVESAIPVHQTVQPAIPAKLSIQLLATELGLGQLTQSNIEDIGKLAAEIYSKLRVKVSPKRFKCLCMGCCIPNCAKSKRDVLLTAVKKVML